MNSKEALVFIYNDELNLYEYEEDMDVVKREITKKEKLIVKDIMSRSNYEEERATEIAKAMVDFGYTIHEQEYFKLKKVIEILKDRLGLYLEYAKLEETEFYSIMSKVLGMCLFNTTKEEYDLLKEVLLNG